MDETVKDGVCGDEITLTCIANLFNVEITIILTLGNGGRVSILPENSHPTGKILLSHFAEGQGDQCVCLDQVNGEDIDDTDGNKMETV